MIAITVSSSIAKVGPVSGHFKSRRIVWLLTQIPPQFTWRVCRSLQISPQGDRFIIKRKPSIRDRIHSLCLKTFFDHKKSMPAAATQRMLQIRAFLNFKKWWHFIIKYVWGTLFFAAYHLMDAEIQIIDTREKEENILTDFPFKCRKQQ